MSGFEWSRSSQPRASAISRRTAPTITVWVRIRQALQRGSRASTIAIAAPSIVNEATTRAVSGVSSQGQMSIATEGKA